MAYRPCLDCGKPGPGARCVEHARAWDRARRPSPAARGYDYQWRKLSAAARAAHPYCGMCGATEKLTTDHVVPGDARTIRVLCRACHGAIGARRDRPQGPRLARGRAGI